MKIFVIIDSLDSGGAEKSTIKLCEGFVSDGHKVKLVTLSSESDFYLIPEGIARITLDGEISPQNRKITSYPGLKRISFWTSQIHKGVILRKMIRSESPDCVIAMSASVSVFTYFCTRFIKLGTIGSERIHPSSEIWSHGFLTDLLRPFIYHNGMILSVQSKSVSDWCLENWNCTSVITPNHLSNISKSALKKSSYSSQKEFLEVLAVGRDHPQKNFDFLLSTWKHLEASPINFRLSIVGPADVSRLNQLVEKLNLKCVNVISRTVNLDNHYKKAGVLISTSHFEGFPNVVLEALSYGIPVVTTPSCDVVQDFEKAGACVVLETKDPEDFARAVIRIVSDTVVLSKMSQNAFELSTRYSWDQISKDWYKAIDSAQKLYR